MLQLLKGTIRNKTYTFSYAKYLDNKCGKRLKASPFQRDSKGLISYQNTLNHLEQRKVYNEDQDVLYS